MIDYCTVDIEELSVIRNRDNVVLAKCWDDDHCNRTAERLNYWFQMGWPPRDEEWD